MSYERGCAVSLASDPKTCALCRRTALYRVGDRGFCRGHLEIAKQEDAVARRAAEAAMVARQGHHGLAPQSGRNRNGRRTYTSKRGVNG